MENGKKRKRVDCDTDHESDPNGFNAYQDEPLKLVKREIQEEEEEDDEIDADEDDEEDEEQDDDDEDENDDINGIILPCCSTPPGIIQEQRTPGHLTFFAAAEALVKVFISLIFIFDLLVCSYN